MEGLKETKFKFLKHLCNKRDGNKGIFKGTDNEVVRICKNGVMDANVPKELKLGKMTRTLKRFFLKSCSE